MVSKYEKVLESLKASPKRWVVTGGAGFIGSNLAETLLLNDQEVVILDNLSTGYEKNVNLVREKAGAEKAKKLQFVLGDINDLAACEKVCKGASYVLHQAALGSVPRSIEDPVASNHANVNGFVTMLHAAKNAGVSRFVYASSSAVYGDSPELPKVEHKTGSPLSPYAVTKSVNELYAKVWHAAYGFRAIGLRYFNVFGPRQDPAGAYAAVVPRWIDAASKGQVCTINGDGETSRDFCYIENVVQANILSAIAPDSVADEVYNVAVGDRTTLNELHDEIWNNLVELGKVKNKLAASRLPFRAGDIRHSLADISKIREKLGYEPKVKLKEGLKKLISSMDI